ncbi:hypothetical protein AXG93_2490s1140 [Marchantia polymorpha subsp. ruderalis]|uniref:Uncharacterized protein n=1 Tax=Marchantia polymorpha subsp. ruderalis TaxID=1480154 RepID=A0A176W5L8_MARPO|nr:hypothetical protein AXG93_2490s1140 [Marchantia polymorpha subsp. ruderalis]
MEDKSLDWMDEGFEEDVQIDQDGFPIFPIQEIASEVDSTVITSKDRGRAGAAGAAGGPLAVPGFTSGRINVHNFRQSCGALLSTLKAGLADCSMEVDDICVSVDDLKVMTDAMLVEKALAEVLQGQSIVPVGENPQEKSSEDNGIGKEHITLTLLSIEGAAVAAENGNGNHSEQVNVCSKPRKNERGKKRGRPFDRNVRGALLMDDTDERRKEALERLKRERERARESVSLHSLRAKKERESLYKKIQTPLRTLKFLNSILKTPKLASKTEFQPMVDGEVLITIEIYDSIKRYLKDVFYNDMRHPKALDYSLPIRNWVREQAEVIEKWKALGGVDLRKRRWLGLPSCPRAKNPPTFLHNRMEDVCFADLECRIGAQFLYCHQVRNSFLQMLN